MKDDIGQFNSKKAEAEQEDKELELHMMEYDVTQKGHFLSITFGNRV